MSKQKKTGLVDVTDQFLSDKKKIAPLNLPKGVAALSDIIDLINDPKFKAYTVDVLQTAPRSFHNDDILHRTIRKAFVIFHSQIKKNGIDGQLEDAAIMILLIARILKNEIKEEKYQNVYPLLMDAHLKSLELNDVLPQGVYENMMNEISGHLGTDSIYRGVASKPGSLGYELNLAFSIAESPHIEIDSSSYIRDLG